MSNEFFENYQYNSCISRGICSINPRNSALQTVIVLYLRVLAKYAQNIKLEKNTKDFILNTISITIFNPEFNENSFIFAAEKFKEELPKIMEDFSLKNPNTNMDKEKQKALELFEHSKDITSAIKLGEKIFNRAQESIQNEIRDLYSIILVIAKSMSINLLELESFDKEFSEAFDMILRLLTLINLEENSIESLKKEIYEASLVDNNVVKALRYAQEERYGKQTSAEVSFTTIPNKAVLIVGSNIRELETILEALDKKNIDVYTHDDMMIAHTFPKFSTYPHLKGQFGQGLENCLLDFATFPGPIILTKNSLHNIENFYRGILFTTDYTTSPKGIIKINNNDYSKVIEAAEAAKGFKRGRVCETISIGYDFEEICKSIQNKIAKNSYEHIFIIGNDGYSLEQKAYFEKLIKLAPQNTLIISFSYNIEKENLIHINTCYDNFSWIKIFDYTQKFNISTTIFVPKCERSTISQIVYLSECEKTKIYLGKCTPIILNPSLMNTLQNTFNIKSISNSKKDLEEIFKDN